MKSTKRKDAKKAIIADDDLMAVDWNDWFESNDLKKMVLLRIDLMAPTEFTVSSHYKHTE